MKKFAALLLSAVLAMGLFAGCSTGSDGLRDIPGWDDSKKNVVFYAWGNKEENAILDEIMENFNADNPDMNVLRLGAGNDYYGDLELRIAGNQSPDIVLMKPGYIGSYLRSGAIISLQEYIDSSTVIDKDTMLWDVNDGYRYNPETKERGTKDGEIYSLIKDFSPDFVMNYNKNKITDKVAADAGYPKEDETNLPSTTEPMTWSQFVNFGKSVQSSKMTGTHLDNEPYQQILEWIQMAGGSLYSEDDKTVVDIKNTPAVRAAFDHYREMVDENSDNTPIALRSSVQVGPGQLKQDQTASIFYGRWAYSSHNFKGSQTLDCGFAPPPVPETLTVTDDTKYAGITAMVGLSISAKSKQQDAAFKFIEYYFTEGQEVTAKLGYNIPGNKAVAETTFLNDESISASEKAINQFFLDLAKDHSFVIKFNNYLSQGAVEDVFSNYLTQYFADAKGKAYNNALWEKALDDLRAELQTSLTRAVRSAERH